MSRSAHTTIVGSDTLPSKWVPQTDDDLQAIREQLARVLASPPFRTSKRYPALLNHVVEKVLQGDTEALKERTLGVEVFRRDAQYDTNADPVVRIAAGEVRKRLAQYYYDVRHRGEILIELAPGSYVPEFYKSVDGGPCERIEPGAPKELDDETVASPELAIGESARNRWPALVCLLCLILGFGAGELAARRRSAAAPLTAIDEFWRPLVGAPGTVWLCVGEAYASRIELNPNGARSRFDSKYKLTSDEPRVYPTLNLADSSVLASVAGLLQSRNKAYSVHGETDTAFSDLASGPDVLIGSFNNDWTIRLSDQLRFHFEMDNNTGEQWIVDRSRPDEKIGAHFSNISTPDSGDAYAIISRVRDASTGQIVVTLAGLSTNGTKAAGRFVSEAGYLQEFAKRAPSNWQNGNLQIVIAAALVDGSLGPPRVVSDYVW